MTGDPRAFLAIDRGAATTSAALVGRVGSAWRLIGSASLPATVDDDAVVHLLLRRLSAVDPDLTRRLGIHDIRPDALPAVTVRSAPARHLAVVAASDRSLAPLAAAAACSGWRITAASAETMDPLAMSRLLLDGTVDGILAGAGDPPGADERGALAELTALVAAVAGRRQDRLVILAGAMAEGATGFGGLQTRSGETLLAPAARTGGGVPLRALLAELALPPDDARRALGHAAETLAVVLDRRIELVDIGYDGGTRAVAAPGGPGEGPTIDVAVVPTACLAPADPDDAVVDRVLGWLTVVSDRHRLRDRMRELRIAPWADATGDGVALRMAAARAALGRLLDATAGATGAATAPDLMVVSGGVWATVAPPAAALAVADVLRRPGASAFALDHARLLGPLGSIPDPDERRAVFGDLVDDLLLPLGTIVTPAGLHSGRSVGSLTLRGRSDRADHGPMELHPGGLEVVDLPPGVVATAEFKFRDSVRLGARGRHFAVEVAGGLGGVLVDLRDVPLRLPERADRRRELLDGWQTAALRDGAARA